MDENTFKDLINDSVDGRKSKIMKLRPNRICLDLIMYTRILLMDLWDKEIKITKCNDLNYEALCVSFIIKFLYFYKQKFCYTLDEEWEI